MVAAKYENSIFSAQENFCLLLLFRYSGMDTKADVFYNSLEMDDRKLIHGKQT